MKDMMMDIYSLLILNETISAKVGKTRVKFFEVSDTFDTSKPFIIIDTFDGPQSPAYFAADKELSTKFNYQINVESSTRLVTKEISKAVKDVLTNFGFVQLTGGLDTYFPETKRFVDARRYRRNTTIHDTDY